VTRRVCARTPRACYGLVQRRRSAPCGVLGSQLLWPCAVTWVHGWHPWYRRCHLVWVN